MKIKIGNIELGNNVLLAPMAGITDRAFRTLCIEQGCGLVYTEMASAKGMHFGGEKSEKIVEISPDEMPAAIQLFGSDPEIMAEISYKLNESPAVLLDINMGCPAPKIIRNGEGSGLMKAPKIAERIIKAVVRESKKPVTVKFRKGWDDESVNGVEFAKMAEQAGASAVTIHGRTRCQFYSGRADWDIIYKIKRSIKIPVIGNGDVTSPETARNLFDQTGCDAIMVGRAAQGNPWIFAQINEYHERIALDASNELHPSGAEGVSMLVPSDELKLETMLRHLKMMVELKGERIGINEMRTHISHYVNGMKNAARFRDYVFKLDNKEAVEKALIDFFRR